MWNLDQEGNQYTLKTKGLKNPKKIRESYTAVQKLQDRKNGFFGFVVVF